MSLTRSHPGLEVETPQHAYALAILSGGVAFILPQIQSQIPAWLPYALLALIFSLFWPHKFWQWAIWLCLPLFLLILLNLISTGSLAGVLFGYGMMFVKSSFYAYAGAYLGSKLSVHKLAARSAHGRKLKRGGKRRSGIPASKEPATPIKAIALVSHIRGLNAALIEAVQEGDLGRIRRLIADGADVNACSNDRWAPPVIAAQGFDVEAVKTLFGQGSADGSVCRGWTALMVATIEGHREVVTALVEYGAEVNARNDQGWTALRFAVSLDDFGILGALLDAGADANIPDLEGRTALMQAASENIEASLKMLLSAGALPHVKDGKGQTALTIAKAQSHTEIVKLLEEAGAPNNMAVSVSLFA